MNIYFKAPNDTSFQGNCIRRDGTYTNTTGTAYLTAGTFTTAQGGTVVVEADGDFTYTAPSTSYTGQDYFDATWGTYVFRTTLLVNLPDNSTISDSAYLYHGSEGAETITGDSTDNSFLLRGGNDVVYGGNGAEGIEGGSGNDTLNGGSGNDYLQGGTGIDVLNGGDGNDHIWGYSAYDETTDDNIVNGGDGNDEIFSGGLIHGDAGNDQVTGGTGDDTVYGDDGDDSLFTYDGNDVIFGGAGVDVIDGEIGNDYIEDFSNNAYQYLRGGEGNDIVKGHGQLTGGWGNDIIVGSDLPNGWDSVSDYIFGNQGNDIIFGMGGNDCIYGGAGMDLIFGGEGNDVIFAYDTSGFGGSYGSQNDYLEGGDGTDALYGGDGDDTLILDAGGDTARGDASSNVGYDKFIVKESAFGNGLSHISGLIRSQDTLDLSSLLGAYRPGIDDINDFVQMYRKMSASYDGMAFAVDREGTGSNFTDVVVLDSSIWSGETISNLISTGTLIVTPPAADPLTDITHKFFSALNDTPMEGNVLATDGVNTHATGSATLVAGTYATMQGGRITIEADGDFVYTAPTGYTGSDLFTYTTTSDATYFVGLSVESAISGTATDDRIFGNPDNDTLSGGSGADLVYGRAGDDTISGGTGNDTLYGDGGADTISGGSGNDVITDTSADANVINGNDGNDTITGRGLIHGNNGNDTITGSAGTDTIYGDDNVDVISAGAGNDVLYGGESNDTLDGGADADTIYGGAGNDSIIAGDGNDYIETGNGADYVTAGAGADTILVGGAGSDTIDVGYNALSNDGVDTVIIDKTAYDNGVATVASFDATGDKLDLSRLLDNYDPNTDDIADFISKTVDGTGTLFAVDINGGGDYVDVAMLTGRFLTDSLATLVTNGVLIAKTPPSVPIAEADAFLISNQNTLAGNVLVNNGNGADHDPDSHTLSVVAATLTTSHGASVTINTDGTFTYAPISTYVGTDSFNYTLKDSTNAVDAGLVTITVVENQTPVAADDDFTTNEDTPLNGNLLDDNGNGTDFDPDNDTLTVTSGIFATAHGSVTIEADGDFTYTANANYHGSDSFEYTINDPEAGDDTATVNITVDAVNDAPVGYDDAKSTDEDTAATGNLLSDNGSGADSDVDGDTLAVTGAAFATAHGYVTITTNGNYAYTPVANYNGTDSFDYTVNDGHGGSDTATMSLTINAVNDAPSLTNNGGSVDQDAVLTLTLAMLSASDVDNSASQLSFGIEALATHGTLELDNVAMTTSTSFTKQDIIDGKVTYTPDENYVGSDDFSFIATDGTNDLTETSFDITVNTTGSTFTGTSGADTLSGGSGNDSLYGLADNDVLNGYADADLIYGGDGHDVLHGGAGVDNLYGGAGNDTFVYNTDDYGTKDTIYDFSTVDDDVLDLSGLLGAYDSAQDAITDFVTFTTSGGNTTVAVDKDGAGTTFAAQDVVTVNGQSWSDVGGLITDGHLIVEV